MNKKNIYINSDGSIMFTDAQEKLQDLKKHIQPKLIDIKERLEINDMAIKPRKLNFNTALTTLILNFLSKYENVPHHYAVKIDKDTLREYILAFREMVSFVLEYYNDYVCTKEQFNAFIGIGYGAYSELLNSANGDILAEMERLEGFFSELQFVSAQSGVFKEKSTETRLRSAGVGHNLNIKPDITAININQTYKLDNESIQKRLDKMFGNKQIE